MEDTLLNKYFRGECSPEEVKRVLAWFKESEITAQHEQELYRLWEEAETGEDHKEFSRHSASILKRINEKIDKQTFPLNIGASKGLPRIPDFRSDNWRGWMKVAAAIFFPICFVGIFTIYNTSKTETTTPLFTVTTGPGIRKKINLEDGSRITLNQNSRISYPPHFLPDKREITLAGEAFFEVAKDKRRPFVVKAGSLLTQALGTSFNINYRPEKQDMTVALTTGSVKIDKNQAGRKHRLALLVPGQQLKYNPATQTYKVSAFDPLEILSWQQGILYFKKANLEQVIQKLENWYGIDIQIAGMGPGKEKVWHYTGSYRNQSLENVLAGIAFVKYFAYEKKGNKVIIKFN